MTGNEISASSSQAVLISEIAELRRQLWQVIAAGKKVLPSLHESERGPLIRALVDAEKQLR